MARRLSRCLIAPVVVLAGCFATGPKIIRQSVQQEKTLAIVGFSGLIQVDQGSTHSEGDLINGVKAVGDVATGTAEQKRNAEALRVYQDLSDRLAKNLGWTVLPHDALVKTAAYQQLLTANPNQGKSWDALQRLNDVLRAEVVQGLDANQRGELAKALGVDAIAVAKVIYVTGSREGGFTVKTHPQAFIQFTVYDTKTNQEIWSDMHAVGQPTQESLDQNWAGVNDTSNQSEVYEKAADSALDALITRYQKQ